jgi:amino acid transporter
MWLLLFVFLLNFVAAQMLLTPEQISNAGPNVLFFFGERFAGSWASYVMVFAVLSSTVATTQTTLLPAARITYAMARDGVFPKLFGSVHEKYQTPALGTVILSLVSLFGIMLTTFSASMNTVFNNLVNNIGILVAFYYGATGLACAWAFRKTVGKAWWPNVTMVWMPLLGGIGLLYTCYEVIVSGGSSTIPDVVIVAIGIPLTIWAKVATRRSSPFFHQRPVSYDTLDELDRPSTL